VLGTGLLLARLVLRRRSGRTWTRARRLDLADISAGRNSKLV